MRWLASHGYDEVAINIFYLADTVRATFGDGSRFGVKLRYLEEPELTGSAGGLKQMEGWFDETFVVVGCDDLTNADLGALVRFHKEKQALATIGLLEVDDVEQYGVVVTEADGRITGFQEKPAKGTERSKLANTGIYVFEPEIFTRIPAKTFYDFGKQVFPELLVDGLPFYAMKLHNAYWRDIGTPGEYRLANEDVVEGRVVPVGARTRGVPPSVRVPASARIDENVRIGDGVVVGDRVVVAGPSVIGDGVRLGDGVRIERSIVWKGAHIGAGAVLRDAIVGERYRVDPGTTVDGAIVGNDPTAA
jgi:NDP-sugar pyrophosphorylase family protein